MDVHIRTLIEFEKIIPHDWETSILCTRTRMCVQQLLDSQDSDEQTKEHLIKYIELAKTMFDYMTTKQTTPLITQPTFEWSIDNKEIKSSCWRLEKLMPTIALTRLLTHEGMDLVGQESHKKAVKIFDSSIQYHDSIKQELKCWKWKTQILGHDELQLDWHVSRLHFLKGVRDMCTLCVGINKQVSPSGLFTLSERIIKNFTLSIAAWHDSEAGHYLPTLECLGHKFSSDILWSQEKYGQSIHRLQNWCLNRTFETEPFCEIKSELEKIDFLLQERINLNNSVYFDCDFTK